MRRAAAPPLSRLRVGLRLRLVLLVAPVVVAALGLSALVVAPYFGVSGRLQEADRELDQVIEGLTYARLLAEQPKHFAEYVYLSPHDRVTVRGEIDQVDGAETQSYQRLVELTREEPEEWERIERVHELYRGMRAAGGRGDQPC